MVEFNQIYSKLVTKIKTRIDRAELPAIVKKESREIKEEKVNEKEPGLGEFVAVLKRTLRGGQEEEKKFEKEFGAVMSGGSKARKKGSQMLYQSLGEVRRNIEVMEKKTQAKNRKVL